jgi:hypothetical protein
VKRGNWTLFWVLVIAGLVLVEIAEITRLFVLPLQTAALNVLGVLFAILLVTILALVGAVFIGIYLTQRMLGPQSFSPFEEEMLKMRSEVSDLRREVQAIRRTQVAATSGPVTYRVPEPIVADEVPPEVEVGM